MKMVKIAIIGYGGMGHNIERIAKEKGHEIKTIIDPVAEGAQKEITKEALEDVDVCIDFTHPSVIMDNIKKYCELKANVIVGTTGWYDHLDEVKKMVKEAGIKFLWGSNFSIGVNLYFRIIDAASKLINNAEDYDIWAYELHHNNKADSPSGTAKTLSDIMLKNIDRKKKIANEMLNRKIEKDELHFASVRGGPVNFEHTIGFDSDADCITIKHAARNRNGYASGAVLAAEWIADKKSGFYELDDVMSSLLG